MSHLSTKKEVLRLKKKKNNIISMDDINYPSEYTLRYTGITQSLIMNWLSCRRKFMLSINRYEAETSINMTGLGSMGHGILEEIYKYGKIPSDKKINKWIDKWIKKNKKDLRGKTTEDIELDATKIFILMSEYVQHYKKDFKVLKVIDIEKEFAIKIKVNDKTILLRGKRDGRFITGKKNVIMEHKFKARISEDPIELKLSFDFQNLFYLVTSDIELKKIFNEVIYNIIRNPGMRPHKGETLKKYGIRLRKDIQSRPEFYFIRYRVNYSEKDKKKFREELNLKLSEIHDCIKGKLPTYKNEASCVTGWECKYLRACSSNCMNGFKQKEKLFSELETV